MKRNNWLLMLLLGLSLMALVSVGGDNTGDLIASRLNRPSTEEVESLLESFTEGQVHCKKCTDAELGRPEVMVAQIEDLRDPARAFSYPLWEWATGDVVVYHLPYSWYWLCQTSTQWKGNSAMLSNWQGQGGE